MSELYALLIGVDFYFEHTLPDGSYFPSLGGCVRDIRLVETFLTDPARLNMPRQNLLMLTATDTHGETPAEPPEQWPTYENMVAKFKALGALAQPGDQLYIQYSGHGGRATTIYDDLKGASGVDEALVPLDIGDPQARYLRDVELYFLIDELVKKDLRVTVVFDCCNSGGATRGLGGAVKRGIGTIDTTARPTDSLVAASQVLTANWRAAARTRDHKPASGWLLEPTGYTFFAACRASESAFEYPFNGRESNGALTYWMLDTLRQAGPGLTYKLLHDRVLAKVHGQFEQQTPMLQGEGDVRVFGSERLPPVYAVPVLQLDPAGNRVRINAGEVHGVAVGTQFAVYPLGTTDFSRAANRIALLETTLVNEADAWATIVTQSSDKQIEEGAQAILLHSANVRLRREVTVVVADPTIKQQVEAAITAQGSGFVVVATADKSDFQVALNAQQQYEIWDAAGAPIPNLRPPIGINEADAPARLVARLVHLAKYYGVRDLTAPDMNSAQKLAVTLTSLSGEAEKESGGAPIYKPGDKAKFVIQNTQTPGEANDPTLILNVTVLDLAPDWSVTQIFPTGAALFEPLDPGKTFEFEFEAFLADGRTAGVDTLKVFATRATTNFRWLELPALDQPPAADAIQRAAIRDPLEALLASITGERAATRDVRVTSSPQQSRSWTTSQVELRVQA